MTPEDTPDPMHDVNLLTKLLEDAKNPAAADLFYGMATDFVRARAKRLMQQEKPADDTKPAA